LKPGERTQRIRGPLHEAGAVHRLQLWAPPHPHPSECLASGTDCRRLGRRASAPPWHARTSAMLSKAGRGGGSDWLAAPERAGRLAGGGDERLVMGGHRQRRGAAAPAHPHRGQMDRESFYLLRALPRVASLVDPRWTLEGSIRRAAWSPFPLCAWDNSVSMTARQSGLRLDISGRARETAFRSGTAIAPAGFEPATSRL
jgi:hypothetical protein